MSAKTHRQRRQHALTSFLAHPFIDGVHREFHGDPRKAPKRWKRLWARQWRFVKTWRALERKAKRAAAQKGQ